MQLYAHQHLRLIPYSHDETSYQMSYDRFTTLYSLQRNKFSMLYPFQHIINMMVNSSHRHCFLSLLSLQHEIVLTSSPSYHCHDSKFNMSVYFSFSSISPSYEHETSLFSFRDQLTSSNPNNRRLLLSHYQDRFLIVNQDGNDNTAYAFNTLNIFMYRSYSHRNFKSHKLRKNFGDRKIKYPDYFNFSPFCTKQQIAKIKLSFCRFVVRKHTYFIYWLKQL